MEEPLVKLLMVVLSPMFILLGILSLALFHPFSWFFVLLTVLGFLMARIFLGPGHNNKFLWIFGLGNIGLWLSLFLSYQGLPATDDINDVFAVGGFPFKAFDYPSPPMGNDVPPTSMWPAFVADYFVWIASAAIGVSFLPSKVIDHLPKRTICVVLGVLLMLIGFGYLILKFD